MKYVMLQYHTIQQYKIILKVHVNGVEAIFSDIDMVTTSQVRIKGHLSA